MKTRNYLHSVLNIMALATLYFMVAACSPETPEDENQHKLHEDPFKAVLTLQEGRLEGGVFNQNPEMKHFKANTASPAQTIVWEVKSGKGWGVTSATNSFKVKNFEKNPDVVYYLNFEYFNQKGESMNHQFFDNGQDKIHQHFFCVYRQIDANGVKKEVREKKKANIPFDYNYADELNGTFIGNTNPMGFKGFFRFLKAGEKFTMNIELLHATKTKLEKDGKPSPFYMPSAENRSTGLWDIQIAVPIEIEK